MDHIRHDPFTIGLPPGWADATLVLAAGPKRDGFAPTISVLRRPLTEPTTAAAFAALQLPQLAQTLADEQFLLVEQNTHPSTYDAFRFVYHFVLRDGQLPITQMQVYLVVGMTAFVITVTDRSDDFPQHRSVFESAIGQFRVEEESRP
jgi:hypothetical protein